MALVDYFLKIDGIDGESADAKHKGEIELQSWAWAEKQGGTGQVGVGGHGVGKVAMDHYRFTTNVNKSSPKLFLACASGEHIKKAVLSVRKAGKDQQDYLIVTLSDLHIASYNVGGLSNGSVLPEETYTINFTKIEYEYKEQKPDGTLGGSTKAGWDVSKSQKV